MTTVEQLLQYCEEGDVVRVEEALKGGVDVNSAGMDGMTALMHASSNGHSEVVKCLLDRGADSSLADEDGDTALTHAKINSRHEVESLLRSRGVAIVLQI